MKLPIEEPEPYQTWYKKEYTLQDYVTLCERAMQLDDIYHCINTHSIPALLYHEMRYAMQHIKEEKK